MSKIVEERIQELERKEKEKILEAAGLLIEKEYYTGEDLDISEYPFSEYDENTGLERFYRKSPVEVTEEEYEKIKKLVGQKAIEPNYTHGASAIALTVIAVLVILGGFILASANGFDDIISIAMLVSGIVSGVLFFALSRIIRVLENIHSFMIYKW